MSEATPYKPNNPPRNIADVIYLHRFDTADPTGKEIPVGTDLAATYCWSYAIVTGGQSIELRGLLEPSASIDWSQPRHQENVGIVARYGHGFGFPEAVATRVLLPTGAVVVNEIATPTAENDDRGNEIGETMPEIPAAALRAMGLPAGYALTGQDREDLFFCRDFTLLYVEPLIGRFVVGGPPFAPIPVQPATPPVAPTAQVKPGAVVMPSVPAPPTAAPATPVSPPKPAATVQGGFLGTIEALLPGIIEAVVAGAIGVPSPTSPTPTLEQLVEQLAASRIAALPNGQGPIWFTHWVEQMKANPLERALLQVLVGFLSSAAEAGELTPPPAAR